MNDFRIPKEIIELINKGIWPSNKSEVEKQDISPITSEELVKLIATDESYIYFYTLNSFITMREEISGNEDFWTEVGALDEIDIDKCLIIGDFGIGSDSPIVLDYSEDAIKPVVKRLVWESELVLNHWGIIAKDFKEFIDILKLN
jgi:hypothetical protein